MEPVEIAVTQYGNHDIPGILDNPTVDEYIRTVSGDSALTDETAWCAAFVGWCLKQAGRPNTASLAARSYLNYGAATTAPVFGDLVVLWRISPTGPYGHVGFFVRATDTGIYILGGNQSDAVNIALFPKTQLLSYRKIPEVTHA